MNIDIGQTVPEIKPSVVLVPLSQDHAVQATVAWKSTLHLQ